MGKFCNGSKARPFYIHSGIQISTSSQALLHLSPCLLLRLLPQRQSLVRSESKTLVLKLTEYQHRQGRQPRLL